MASLKANRDLTGTGASDEARSRPVFAFLAARPLASSDFAAVSILVKAAATLGAGHVTVIGLAPGRAPPAGALDGEPDRRSYGPIDVWSGHIGRAGVTLLPLGRGRQIFAEAAKGLAAGGGQTSDLAERIDAALDAMIGPMPDLVLVCGGRKDLGGALDWSVAYSEFAFTDSQLPDYPESKLKDLVDDFLCRERRFGGIGAAPAS